MTTATQSKATEEVTTWRDVMGAAKAMLFKSVNAMSRVVNTVDMGIESIEANVQNIRDEEVAQAAIARLALENKFELAQEETATA